MSSDLTVLRRAPAVQSARDLSPAALREAGCDVIDGQMAVQIPDGRTFAVVPGRRWTRVHEYLSNGQLTARWFVDEKSGEAREAAGARAPKAWPMHTGAQEFARWVVQLARDPSGGV